ncbi:MAG: radical SAM protein [Elusimicrobia bacterium]|nr:radical SAM protein [Elusimicrobiota bacterium]
MKILFVQPLQSLDMVSMSGTFYLSEPLALETIAATVQEHERKILDMRLEPNLEQELINFKPDIVATTSYTPEVYRACKVLEKVKKFSPDILTVVGGHHATIMPQDFKKEYIDVIVIGEGEITFPEFVTAYENNKDIKGISGLALNKNSDLFFTQPRKMLGNLDETPLPDRNLTQQYRNKYFRLSWHPVACLMTSRGCVFRCNFCSVWKHEHGKFRVRTPERTIREIMDIKEKYISVSDDDFFQNPRRAKEIYKAIKEHNIQKEYKVIARSDSIIHSQDIMKKWKEIGLETVTLGLESFRDEELVALNKRNTIRNNEEAVNILHRNGISVTGHFIVNPAYQKEDFKDLISYVKKIELDYPMFSILTPLPGTDLFKEVKDQILTDNLEMFDYAHAVIPTKLPQKEFYKYFIDLIYESYSDIINKRKSKTMEKIIKGVCESLERSYQLL